MGTERLYLQDRFLDHEYPRLKLSGGCRVTLSFWHHKYMSGDSKIGNLTISRGRYFSCLWVLANMTLAIFLIQTPWAFSQQVPEVGQQKSLPPSAFLVRVPLPVDDRVSKQVTGILERIAKNAPPVTRPEDRLTVVLKFDTDRGKTGLGSQLTRCLDISRLLSSEQMIGLKFVAYIPAPKASVLRGAKDGSSSRLEGNAVLIALATEQILAEPNMKIGNANSDSPRDPLEIDIYRNVAEKRLVLPPAIFNSMIDPVETVFRVTTDEGESLVDTKQLQEFEATGRVVAKKELSAFGQTALYNIQELAALSPRCREVADKSDLAQTLKIDLSRLEFETIGDREWHAVQFDLPKFIDARTVDWGIRAIEQRLSEGSQNLLIINMENCQGDLNACLKLARYLTNFDSDEVQTTAFVRGNVAGPAGVVALACDHILMEKTAVLGGPFQPLLVESERDSAIAETELIAEDKERQPSWYRAMIDLTAQPAADNPNGQLLNDDAIGAGFDAKAAEETGMARAIINSPDELQTFYQLESSPEQLTPTKTDRLLDRFAAFLAQPMISVWLLMAAVFLISTEMQSPGLSVPGFLGATCLVLFFWSQYLDGNAEWFEILLFVIGALFVVVEIFVIPGFGIFGIGGLIMMVISLVLATQTFVLPRSAEDYKRLPISLGMVLAAASSFLAAIYVLKRYSRSLPFFQKMMLDPPAPVPEFAANGASPQMNLVGRKGIALTKLIPSGKAKIAGKILDVMTDGMVVEANTPIVVIESVANRIVVEPCE